MTHLNLTHLRKTTLSSSPSKAATSGRCDSEVRGPWRKLFCLHPVALLEVPTHLWSSHPPYL